MVKMAAITSEGEFLPEAALDCDMVITPDGRAWNADSVAKFPAGTVPGLPDFVAATGDPAAGYAAWSAYSGAPSRGAGMGERS